MRDDHSSTHSPRLYREHPGEEAEAIITQESGPPMLMGFADVLRVFGDSHLKRTAAESKL